MHAATHIGLTRLRRVAATLAVAGQDARLMQGFRARDSNEVFYILGTGASVNDLRASDWAAMAAGRSVSINMAILAPLACDICSFEFMPNSFLADTVTDRLRGRERPFVLWVQDRARHRSPHLDVLAAEFPMHRYRPVDVSTGGQAGMLEQVWVSEMRAWVLEQADLRLSYALIGSVARTVLLGLALGYRRICLVGIDQNANPYFWQEDRMPDGSAPWVDGSGVYSALPQSGLVQSRGVSLVDFLHILHRDGAVFSVIDPRRRSALSAVLPQHRV